jgi:polyisoprenoid-binding protein YceI
MRSGELRQGILAFVTILLVGLLAACGSSDPTPAAMVETPATSPTQTPTPPAELAAPEAPADTTSVTTTATMTATTPISATTASTDARAPVIQVFSLDPAQSEARFRIDEVLRGTPTTVVGVTSLVSGDITINLTNPAATTLGIITIDARDLATHQNMRNRAIRNFVLQSAQDAYQFITFEPTAIAGLPATVQPGDSFSFNVTGNLKIRDVVNLATFAVEITADSATQISGLAQTTIALADYGLNIPDVPFVADVGEDVGLELQFVANAQ